MLDFSSEREKVQVIDHEDYGHGAVSSGTASRHTQKTRITMHCLLVDLANRMACRRMTTRQMDLHQQLWPRSNDVYGRSWRRLMNM